jgi:protein ImuB
MSFMVRRIACLRIPDFPIAAHLRAEGRGPAAAAPADPSGPAIVAQGGGKQAVVAAASPAARRLGIAPGMRAADARAQHPGLREWVWSPALYDDMQTELAAALLAASPRVSRAGLGAFWLDAGGWDRRGGEEAFIEAARSAALAAGYPEARVAIAGTAAAARAATQLEGCAVCRVPPGEEARFLAPFPLHVLPISEELLELLEALGLATVGEFAELKPGEVEARLGAAGVQAHRWARGLDDGREGPFAGRAADDWSVEVELPGPVERLEPLLFLLKSCLDHLSDALAVEGLCVRGLELTIETEEGPARQSVRPARPTRRAPMLLSLCRSALDGLYLPGRALGVRVEAEEVVPALAEQADLFEPPRPDPDALATALTRLQGRWGTESVVRPKAADSHRPERQGRWEPVELMAELTRRTPAVHRDESNAPGGDGAAPERWDAPALVLRLWPQPRPVEVRIEAGRPGALALDGGWRRIHSLQGPERLSGDWWEDEYRREYYWVTTEAGDLLWVFYDPRRRSWFWHGWWD